MKEKQCFKCHRILPMSEYYKHKAMSDGHLGKCKECTKSDVAKHRQENLEKVREYDRIRASEPHRMEAKREYMKRPRPREIKQAFTRKRRREEPGYMSAHNRLIRAVYSGKIKRPKSCGSCGKRCTPSGHHDDYSKPLDVLWLCSKCHRARHIELGGIS